MELLVKPARSLQGTVAVPGDKSISHRAVMLGALAEGETRIKNFLPGADCLATVECFRKMGVSIETAENGEVRVEGVGMYGLKEPSEILDACNSGTTMRLLLGILAGQNFFAIVDGDASLRNRPMTRVTNPLIRMGAWIDGRRSGNLAPLVIRGGRVKSINYDSPLASAQVKSAVLLAGLFASGETTVTEPCRSRDHTERMLSHFGANVQLSGSTVSVKGPAKLRGRELTVPGDISSASFFIVAATLLQDSDIVITGVGVNPTRCGIIDALQQMGADINLSNERFAAGEPVADIRVRYAGRLKGARFDGSIIPRMIDEIPVLALSAALAEGVTEIRDASELKVKESNRITSTARLINSFGAKALEQPDGLLIEGVGSLRGCTCSSDGDHRVALTAVIAGLLSAGGAMVRGAGCIDVSFPGFADVLKTIMVE